MKGNFKCGDCYSYIIRECYEYQADKEYALKQKSIFRINLQGGLEYSDEIPYYPRLWECKGNIFQEYARTGIIENELYKQFFK